MIGTTRSRTNWRSPFQSMSLFFFFTAALQFNVSPWHGIEARVDSLMASVSTDTSKSFTVHLKTKEKQSFSRDADKNVFAWHVVCHIRTSDTDCFELGVIVNLSLAVGDEEQRIRSFPLRLKSKEEKLEEVFFYFLTSRQSSFCPPCDIRCWF